MGWNGLGGFIGRFRMHLHALFIRAYVSKRSERVVVEVGVHYFLHFFCFSTH